MRDCLFLYWCWCSITLFSNCLQKRLYEPKILECHLFLSPIVIPAAGDKGFFLTMWTLVACLLIPVMRRLARILPSDPTVWYMATREGLRIEGSPFSSRNQNDLESEVIPNMPGLEATASHEGFSSIDCMLCHSN
jgi:hypothetical protein